MQSKLRATLYFTSWWGMLSMASCALQPCLGGSGKTLMLVNVNPEEESLQETVCSLRFAAKVNACETGAKGGAKRHVQQAGDPTATPAQVSMVLYT